MELNRNQYFFMGVLVLLLGVQLRLVDSYTLTEDATKFLAERSNSSAHETAMFSLSSNMGAMPQKVITLPEWSGWCMISIGIVLILHSLAMPKPGG